MRSGGGYLSIEAPLAVVINMSMQMLEEALAEPDPSTRARLFDDLGLRRADTRPGRLIDLTSSLVMAAYPVTVAQFEAFIDAGGYTRTLGVALVEHRLELEAALQLGRRPGWALGWLSRR